jgi:type II secretory pathway predicted ATPase ExeA
MNRKLLAPYGLKFNPFAQEIPVEALQPTARIESFGLRLERQASEGGFALVLGPPGSGKSAALRLLERRLSALPDVTVGVLTRPQCGIADLYRELGHLFGVKLAPHNRWAGSKVLRELWQTHIAASLVRPVLLVDEAQELQPTTLNELRLLASKELDACSLLTIVLCGDGRLADKLKLPDLLPVASRIRGRLLLDEVPREERISCVRHALAAAGNPKLLTPGLISTLCDHSPGDLRSVMSTADEVLQAGLERDGCPLDEKLFLELFSSTPSPKHSKSPGRAS